MGGAIGNEATVLEYNLMRNEINDLAMKIGGKIESLTLTQFHKTVVKTKF